MFNFIEKDWEDIKFGVDNQVDFYAVSFVKDARVVYELKEYLKSNFFLLSNFFFVLVEEHANCTFFLQNTMLIYMSL